MSNFLKAHISGMAGAIYVLSPDMWNLHSEFGLDRTTDYGATNGYKIVLCFFFGANIVTLCMHVPFLGHHDTLPCVLIQ